MSERDDDDEREDDRKKRRSIRRPRDTSISAFEELKRSGKLSRLRWLIYEYLWNVGPSTAQEAFKALGLETNQSGRFTELRDMGFIREVGTLLCEVTGRRVIGWDANDPDEPVRTQKLAPDTPRLEVLEQAAREAVHDLRMQNDLFAARIARKLEDALNRKEPKE